MLHNSDKEDEQHLTNKIEMNKKRTGYSSDFLLPNNNFWVGFGSVLNLAGSYFEYNISKTEEEADAKALASDWKNVGDDIKDSVRILKEETAEEE